MAVDEALLSSCARGPTLRLYTWTSPSITLGHHQKEPGWLPRAGALGIDCVRRITGGGAVLHGSDLTYSVVAPHGLAGIPDGLHASYLWVRQRLLEGLREAGVDAVPSPPGPQAARAELCFAASTGVEIDGPGAKWVGSAQRRTRAGFLQHGSIRFRDDEPLARRVFGHAPAAAPGPAPSADVLRTALISAFAAAVSGPLEPGTLGDSERHEAHLRAEARRANPLLLPRLSLRTARASADTPA